MHPSLHLEVARWRHQDLLADAERRRIAKLVKDGEKSDRGLRALIGGRARRARRRSQGGVTSKRAWPATEERANESSAARAFAMDRTNVTGARELAYRESEGLKVALLWDPADDALTVVVTDWRTGDAFALRPQGRRALDAFYHPFAHARPRALAGDLSGSIDTWRTRSSKEART